MASPTCKCGFQLIRSFVCSLYIGHRKYLQKSFVHALHCINDMTTLLEEKYIMVGMVDR